MKAKLYLLALAAVSTAVMSSCSQDEPISVATTSENAISFRPAMGASRAVETTNENLSQITVSSFIGDQLYITRLDGNDVFFDIGVGDFSGRDWDIKIPCWH